MRLILASRSAARRGMLEAAGVPFESAESAFDEQSAKTGLYGRAPIAMAKALARGKALAVAAGRNDLVLGADQILERSDGSMLSKPAARAEALEQLKSLGGATHRLHSAASIAQGGVEIWSGVESVALTMRPLSDDFLRDYLDREYEAIRWSIGGYRIEGPGVQLFDEIRGSHFAILGLPLLPLLAFLRARGLLES